MKFLVMGCNGMAGHMISLYLRERGHRVLGFALNQSRYVPSLIGNAMNMDDVKRAVTGDRFDAVINCIGILNQHAEEDKYGAVYLNSMLPHYLARLTAGTETQVIHISTDCVFSGQKGRYSENELRDGTSFYDRSKALGELEDDKNLTLRQSIVGPDINEKGIGLLNWFLQQHEPVHGYTKAIWTGQTTLQLAKTMEAAVAERAHGLYNAVPKHSISKYELLQLFNKYIRREPIKIFPSSNVSVDKSLIRTKYAGFNYEIPDYEEMTKQLGDWMRAHKNLYAHYDL